MGMQTGIRNDTRYEKEKSQKNKREREEREREKMRGREREYVLVCEREREREITMGKARGRGNLYCTLINIVTVIEFYTNLSVLNNLFVQKFFFRVLDLFCYKTNEINKDDKNMPFFTMGRSSCNTHFPAMLGNQTLSTLFIKLS